MTVRKFRDDKDLPPVEDYWRKSRVCDCDRYELGEHTVGMCQAMREAMNKISPSQVD